MRPLKVIKETDTGGFKPFFKGLNKILKKFLLFVFLILSFISNNYSQTWTGGAGNNIWSDGANWDTGVAPTASGDVIFNNSTNITIDPSGAVIGTLLLEGGAIVTLDGNLTVGDAGENSVTVGGTNTTGTGTLNINQGATLTINNGKRAINIRTNSSVNNLGCINISGLSNSAQSIYFNNSGGALTNGECGKIDLASGSIRLNNATTTVTNNGLISSTTTIFNRILGTVTNNAFYNSPLPWNNTITTSTPPGTATDNGININDITVSDHTICSGDDAVITMSSSVTGFSYQLRNDTDDSNQGAVVVGTGGDIMFTVNPTVTTTYNILVTKTTSTCTAELVDNAVITVNLLPTVMLGANPAICMGATSAILPYTTTSSSPDQYTIAWGAMAMAASFVNVSTATSLPSSPNEIPLTIPANAAVGTYSGTITVTNSTTGCSSLATAFSVTVNALPTVSGAAVAVCAGTPLALAVTGTGAATLSYSWTGPNGYTSASEDPSITATAAASDAGTYTVVVTDGNGCTAMTDIVVTVNTLPTLALTGTTCSADLSTYTITFTSDGTVTSTAGTVDNTAGTVSNITSGIDVMLTATSSSNCVSMIDVTAPDCNCPSVTAPVSGGNQSICSGESNPVLTASVLPGETVDWYGTASGGTALVTGNTSFTSTETAVGVYSYWAESRVTVSGCTSSTRTEVTLTINALPTITSSITEVCMGSSITIAGSGTAATTNAYVSSTPAAATIDASTGVVIPVAAGTTVITYTDANGCTVTETITVHALPTITSTETEVCMGSSITIAGSGTAATTNTYVSGSPTTATIDASTGVVTPVAAGTTLITYTDDQGCTVDVTVTVMNCTAMTTATINDPSIYDPCFCGNPLNITGTNQEVFLFADFVVISGAVGDTWVLSNVNSGDVLDVNGNPISVGTPLTDLGGGLFRLDLYHNPEIGFNASFTGTRVDGTPYVTSLTTGGSCSCPLIPTMSQWGLIIFGLLILNLSVGLISEKRAIEDIIS